MELRNLQIPISSGMIITAMHLQSPFKDAGFVVGDVITAVDGKPVSSPAEMLYRLSVSESANGLISPEPMPSPLTCSAWI